MEFCYICDTVEARGDVFDTILAVVWTEWLRRCLALERKSSIYKIILFELVVLDYMVVKLGKLKKRIGLDLRKMIQE